MLKRRWLVAGISGAVIAVTLTGGTAAGQSFVNWAQYLYTPGHTSDNQSATTITPANAGSLTLAWKFLPSTTVGSGLKGFQSSPAVYNGVVYIGARNGYFYAINELTGAVIWQRFIGYVPRKTCGAEGFTSTATVTADPTSGKPTVYVYGASGYLYAMNAADGTDAWPPAKVAIPSTTVSDYYAWDSPLVFGGNIYVGISSECDNPLVRGGLAEFSQATGVREHTFWTAPAGTTGASIWSSATTDGSAVYVTTGNGPSGSEGFSIIKLTPSLKQQLDAWSVPAAQRVTDSDFGGSASIWTASVGGVPTEMVGACNKNGTFYALKASSMSAGPVWSANIGNPYPTGPGQCDAASVYDGSHLYLASDGTTINGTAYNGAVRDVDPATGAFIWQTGLTGAIIGTPGMDGAGLIAAASYASPTKQNGVFLIDAATGQIRRTIIYGSGSIFPQPVFADGDLFVAGSRGLWEYKP